MLWRADDPTLCATGRLRPVLPLLLHGTSTVGCHRVAALAPDEDDLHALKRAAIVSMSDGRLPR